VCECVWGVLCPFVLQLMDALAKFIDAAGEVGWGWGVG
jgi:hypothetical protein